LEEKEKIILEKKHTKLGKISLITSLTGLGFYLFPFLLMFIDEKFWREIFGNFCGLGIFLISVLLGIIGSLLGFGAYFSKEKDNFGLIAILFGVIMIIIFLFFMYSLSTTTIN